MDSTIVLIKETVENDKYGVGRPHTVEREVLCEVNSATRSEFYQGYAAGFHPELEVEVFFADYDGEEYARHDGKEYKVIRSYRPQSGADGDRLILTLEKKVGGLNQWNGGKNGR